MRKSSPDRPGPLALRIMASATIHRIKEDAIEAATLYASLADEPERARFRVMLFGTADDV